MYQVGWDPAAIDGLAVLLLLHPNRWADINSAVDVIEYRLERYPMVHGREVSEGLWRIDVEPIGLSFTIVEHEIFVESIGWID